MTYFNIFVTLIFLSWLSNSCSSSSSTTNGDNYVRDACNVTRYRHLCIHSLSSFSSTAKRNPRRWARASVTVTIHDAHDVVQHLNKMKKRNSVERRNRAAVTSCVETFRNVMHNLNRTQRELGRLSRKKFESEMDDISAWMSDAFADEHTCLDALKHGGKGKEMNVAKNRVMRVRHVTSNALDLLEKLASTGPQTLTDELDV